MSQRHSCSFRSKRAPASFCFLTSAVFTLSISSGAAAQAVNAAPEAKTTTPDSSSTGPEPTSAAANEDGAAPGADEGSEPAAADPAIEEGVTSDSESPKEEDEDEDAQGPADEDSVEEPSNEEPSSGADADEKVEAASDEEGWSKLEASSAKLEEKPPAPKPYFRTMLLVEGTARYGGLTIAPPGTTLDEEDPDVYESSVGNLGGQVTLGVMPGGSAFLMAGRLRGGSYISRDFTRGNMGAEMLFGANFGRNARGNEFTHILGGFGVEFIPGENQDLLTLSVAAATVVKGVSFGGGLMLEANDEIAIGTLGMQVGWGQLF